MNLTIHRGAREIGGTCVELCAGSSRIILDVGMPLMNPDGSEFDIGDYKGKSGPDLVEAGVLPPVDGLYEWQTPGVDAVLLSHAHQDHYGLVNHVHPDIPVYLGEGAKKTIEISSIFTPTKTTLHKPVVFAWPGEFTIGDFRVTPHLVDHSSFGSFAFEIEAEGKRVFYTGDFRGHGYISDKTLDIIKAKCSPGCDVLLMEGTMLSREDEKVQTEQELAEEATALCRATPGAVLVCQSGQNVSRAVSFYKAARASGREFVLDFYTAHVLTELGHCTGGGSLPYPEKLPGIRVWYPYNLTRLMKKTGHASIPDRYAGKWKMSKPEMAEKLDRILLFVRPSMHGDLEHIQGVAGSALIYSQWEGYLEKDNTRRLLNTCKSLGISIQSLHTSGHADLATLKRLVEMLQPKRIIPIHTLEPEKYAQCFGDIAQSVAQGQRVEI